MALNRITGNALGVSTATVENLSNASNTAVFLYTAESLNSNPAPFFVETTFFTHKRFAKFFAKPIFAKSFADSGAFPYTSSVSDRKERISLRFSNDAARL